MCRLASANKRVLWSLPPGEADAAELLPLLLEGLCDPSADCRFLAAQGAAELIDASGPTGGLLPATADVIPPIRAALGTMDPPVVCAALQLLRQFLGSHKLAGAALRPHYRQLLPRLAPLVLRSQERQLRDGSLDRLSDREMHPGDLVASTLAEMEARGGAGAGAEIKTVVPSWRPAEEELHRGFAAPEFRNGDVVVVARGLVSHAGHRGTQVLAKGTACGTTTLHGLRGGVRVPLSPISSTRSHPWDGRHIERPPHLCLAGGRGGRPTRSRPPTAGGDFCEPATTTSVCVETCKQAAGASTVRRQAARQFHPASLFFSPLWTAIVRKGVGPT